MGIRSIPIVITFTIVVSAMAGCSLVDDSRQPESAPSPSATSDTPTPKPTVASTPTASASTDTAEKLGMTPEQLKKVTEKSGNDAAVAKFTDATCQTYAGGGDILDVIREQGGIVMTGTEALSADKKMFVGALATVAGEKIAEHCPEHSGEFKADVKKLLG